MPNLMAHMLALRDYQTETIDAVRRAWSDGRRRVPVVLPTGAGKTVIFAHTASMMNELGVKVTLVLVHRDELLSQAVDKIAVVAPHLRVGVLKAQRREIHDQDVIVASVQSLAGKRGEGRVAELVALGIRLVIVDECHHAVADTYMAVLRALGCFDADPMAGAYALGVTATLGRADRVALGQVWQEVAHKIEILDMIKAGYLVNARGIRVRVEGLDLRRVARSRGDFREEALGEAMSAAMAPQAIARAYVEHAKLRRGIVFWPTVSIAYEGAEAFNEAGITSVAIDGAMPIEARRRALADFARGDVQAIHNCMILTEGYDAPFVEAVVIARPTSSAPLFIQMAGRGLRPAPGKRDCLILDVVGVTGRHKLASVVDLIGADRVEKLPDDLAEYDELDLLELDEASSGGSMPPEARVDGLLVHDVVDLFGQSHHSWQRTNRGVWFLSTAQHFVFLAPTADPGLYDVGRCPAKAHGGEFVHSGVDLSMAMTLGEQYADDEAFGSLHGATLTRKDGRWRNTAPSTQQLSMAATLDISVPDGTTKGVLSDMISVAMASWRLDSMPCVTSVSMRGYW